MFDPERGTGRTTRQMLEAPREAVFISCNPRARDHDRHLARKLGREDLKIVERSWLDHGWYGKILTGIVIDHAAHLTEKEQEHLLNAMTRIRP
jgi:hypothetical protein